MYFSQFTTLMALSSTIVSAFVPIQPSSTILDPKIWSPISTITLPIPIETSSQIIDSDLNNEELKRQVTGQGAAAALPTVGEITQVSPVTTYQIFETRPGGGAPVQVQVVYTQLFVKILDQWPEATSGSIGLGTIQGQIGVVKTKRDLPFEPKITQGVMVKDDVDRFKKVDEKKVESNGVGFIGVDLRAMVLGMMICLGFLMHF